MKKRCAGLAVVLFSLVAFGAANADIEFGGVIDPTMIITWIDSVKVTPPDTTFLTADWGSDSGRLDTFVFTGVTEWPASVVLHGTGNGFPFHNTVLHPDTSTWYGMFMGGPPMVRFYGTGYGAVGESRPAVARLPRLAVSPSIVTGQMTVRLQPVGASRAVVDIHDAVGSVVRSLDCTAGAGGVATATWNREDDRGRLVPEGVYFCRYAASDIIAVRKVLVAR